MVIHDATLRRYRDARPRLPSTAPNSKPGSRLEEVFHAISFRRVPRGDQAARHRPESIQVVRRPASPDQAVVSSFLWKELVPLAERVRIALTTAFPTRRTVRAAVEAGAYTIRPERRGSPAALVIAAHGLDCR